MKKTDCPVPRTALPSEDGCRIRHFSNETGEARTAEYPVFPVIRMTYHEIHMRTSSPAGEEEQRFFFEIHHCHSGRMECRSGADFFYLSPGDLAVGCRIDPEHGAAFPLSRYDGITVRIDPEAAPRCLSCLLEDINVSPAALMQKFSVGGKGYIARSHPSIAHIFAELYSVPESIRKGYFKVKILELLLFLSTVEPNEKETVSHFVSGSQTELARHASAYLTEHMERRVPLEELSLALHASATQIKNAFRAVYGEQPYAFIRRRKMQNAAEMLRNTDETVLKIAGRFGYDNASKFAKAFSDVTGMTPVQYRKAPHAALFSSPADAGKNEKE